MAVSMRANVSVASGVARSTRTTTVCKAAQGEASFAKAQIAAAALAAAALISASPVHAGVVLQQPELKKPFQSSAAAEAPKERAFRQPGAKSAPEAKAEAPKKEAGEPLGEFGVDPRVVALPASIAAIGAIGFAISKVDDGFTEWFTESGAMVRNSDNWAGFEEELKTDSYFWNPAPAGAAGSKKVKASKGTKSTRK